MAVQDAVPEEYHRGLSPCPTCGSGDAVLSAPTAYTVARSTEAARRVLRNDDAGRSRKRAAALAISTALPVVPAKELALAPGEGRAAAFGVLTTFFGVVAIVATVVAHATTPAPATPFNIPTPGSAGGHPAFVAIAVVAWIVTAGCLVGLLAALAQRSGTTPGRSAAEAVWRRGWYCCRCSTLYFQPGAEPAGVAAGRALVPREFRDAVWTAGGYGKPAARP